MRYRHTCDSPQIEFYINVTLLCCLAAVNKFLLHITPHNNRFFLTLFGTHLALYFPITPCFLVVLTCKIKAVLPPNSCPYMYVRLLSSGLVLIVILISGCRHKAGQQSSNWAGLLCTAFNKDTCEKVQLIHRNSQHHYPQKQLTWQHS